MPRIDALTAGVTLALLIGGSHLAWALLVASGAAPWLLDVIFRLHFIRPPFEVESFDMGLAAILVSLTTLSGVAFGWADTGRPSGVHNHMAGGTRQAAAAVAVNARHAFKRGGQHQVAALGDVGRDAAAIGQHPGDLAVAHGWLQMWRM